MIYSLSGQLSYKKQGYIVVKSGGVGFKLFVSANVSQSLPKIGEEVNLFTYLYMREDGLELYGFADEQELALFEKLNSVSGIGPKTALGVLAIGNMEQLLAAISQGKSDLLTKASGIGKKTAERIILELRGKLKISGAEKMTSQMESDIDIEEALIGLGYSRPQSKEAVSKIGSQLTNFEDRLKEALKRVRGK